MSEAVKSVIESRSFDDMAPGDVYMCNAPYNGGTHIPDVTVITPIFAKEAHEEAARQATAAAAEAEAVMKEGAGADGASIAVVPVSCGSYALSKEGCWIYKSHATTAAVAAAANVATSEDSAKRVLKNDRGTGWGRPLFFVASRGHHSEIGGITPGSMPPFSRSIEEEGIM
jgi:5-oxoprolinase (ATP-hydrolysing)